MKQFKIILFLIWSGLMIGCRISEQKSPPADIQVQSPLMETSEMVSLIKTGEKELQDGDLVLRRGRDLVSDAIRNFGRRDKSFSHSGIVFIENGKPFVYHILPKQLNPSEKIRKDSMQEFCNPRYNDGFAIYRYDINNHELEKLRSIIYDWCKRDVKFDMMFDLKSDENMYCSEMLQKAYQRATGGKIHIVTTRPTLSEATYFANQFKVPLSMAVNKDVVAIDDLYLNGNCHFINQYIFDTLSVR